MTTSNFFPYQAFDVFRDAGEKIHVQHASAERFGHGIFVVFSGQRQRKRKGEVHAQFPLVEIRKVIDEGQRTA